MAQSRTAPAFSTLYREALVRKEKEFGPEDPNTAESLTDLAFFLERSGDLPLAEPLLRRTEAIKEKQLGPQDVRVAASLLNLEFGSTTIAVTYKERWQIELLQDSQAEPDR